MSRRTRSSASLLLIAAIALCALSEPADAQCGLCSAGCDSTRQLCSDTGCKCKPRFRGDGCLLEREKMQVFLTNTTYTGGQIGGVSGADLICQTASNSSTGVFRAYIRTNSSSPSTAFLRSDGYHYIDPTRRLLAFNWTQFESSPGGVLDYVHSPGTNGSTEFWTGSSPESDCAGWTSSNSTLSASYGINLARYSNWTLHGLDSCDKPKRLLCVQQELYGGPCASSPCANDGVCLTNLTDLSYRCACKPGFSGERCQTNIDECASAPCVNGTCIDVVDSYQCNCSAGFIGTHCQTNVDECASSPCLNGGTCTDQANGFQCTCSVGYSGIRCQDYFDACEAYSPCQNGGTCARGRDLTQYPTALYACFCQGYYEGINCTDVSPCASSPCLNGGACSLTGGSEILCLCGSSPYSGQFCQNCVAPWGILCGEECRSGTLSPNCGGCDVDCLGGFCLYDEFTGNFGCSSGGEG